ncbi:MAG: hypothetical protein VB118_03045 [Oscillospiraceae bacterium]|nr:hypothetical protein [Oscillospiraceae bacterium]
MSELNSIQQIVLNNIITVMPTSSLTEQVFADVLLRLDYFGYVVNEGDSWVLSFSIQKIENNIKNSCNITSIPNELFNTVIDMVCGEFLFSKKSSGQLQGFTLNLDAAVKQIQEGDTSVSFGDGSKTPEQRLDLLIAYLMQNGKSEFVQYRRLKW